MEHELYVDGTSLVEGDTGEDGFDGFLVSMDGPDDPNIGSPYWVFDATEQDYLAGPFTTYGEAKTALDKLAG